MVINFLFNHFYTISNLVINLVPEIDVNFGLIDLIAPIANFIGYLDTFVDLGLITSCIAFTLIVDNWSLVVKILTKLWELL